jgi:hypothetical protein
VVGKVRVEAEQFQQLGGSRARGEVFLGEEKPECRVVATGRETGIAETNVRAARLVVLPELRCAADVPAPRTSPSLERDEEKWTPVFRPHPALSLLN